MKAGYSILKSLIFFQGLLAIIIYSGCYWDNEEYLYPKLGQCDTSVYTYSTAVKPVFDSYCLSCHANNVAATIGGNIKLGSYADVKTNADNGKLLGSINHLNGFSAMPKGSSKLEDCKITIFEKWIATGTLNN